MEGRELKRSYTHLDMPVMRRHYQNQHQYAMLKTNKKTPKTKPSLELYKPPSQRDIHQTKLNVHAKEFNPLQNSKSSGTLLSEKKSGIINNSQKTHPHQVKFVDDVTKASNLMKSKSTTSALHENDGLIPIAQIQHFRDKTSKFIITKACTAVQDMSLLELIELAPKIIIDHALEDRAHALSYATVAVRIIEMEPKDNFIEAFLNMCRYTVKAKCLKDNTHRYHAFLAFLNELYSLLKYKQILCKNLSSATPTHIILELVAQVCKSILNQKPLTARQEVECLFFTVTTVGRDLEAEDPKLLEGLMVSVRDAFLSSSTAQPIKRTLLQLVELKASKWVLPAHAVCYYTKSFMKLI